MICPVRTLFSCCLCGLLSADSFSTLGLIASGDDQETIENLVTSYIQKPSCIILLTVAGESEQLFTICQIFVVLINASADWDNQRGYFLAQKHDPNGERTIGMTEFSACIHGLTLEIQV